MIQLATDLAAFAQERKERQRSDENALYGSARSALRRFGTEGWFDALIRRAEGLARREYRDQTGKASSNTLRAEINDFRRMARAMLDKTGEPTSEGLDAQARAISASLVTAAISLGYEAAAVDEDEQHDYVKTWITMEDERVRRSHMEAEGQTVRLGEKFTVGASEMDRPGDLSAPIEEWINCRCVLAITSEQNAALTAAADEHISEGQGIFLIPAADDPINALSSEEAHVTTVWFGLSSENALNTAIVKSHLADVASRFGPVDVDVAERGTLGDDDADVAFLNRDQLTDLRHALTVHEYVDEKMGAVEQFPEWTPHLTLGYPDTPANEGDLPATVRFDRLALWVGKDRYEYALGEEMTEEAAVEQGPIPWWGPLAPEDTMSGDMRKFSAGALRVRNLPLYLSWQEKEAPGHDDSVSVASIQQVWRRDGIVYGSGFFLSSVPETEQVVGMITEVGRMGVSIDADDGTMQIEDRDGNNIEDMSEDQLMDLGMDDIVTNFTDARIAGGTLCRIPAFQEAWVQLGEVPPEFAPDASEMLTGERVVASAFRTISDEPWDGSASRFTDDEWFRSTIVHTNGDSRVKGDNKLPILEPSGALSRAGVHAAAGRVGQTDASPEQISHAKSVLRGAYKDLGEDVPDSLTAAAIGFDPWDVALTAGGTAVRLVSLVATGDLPKMADFEDPGLVGPSPIVVTADGRVFGHLAAWGTCHIGISGVCVTPPYSETDYAYFCTGSVLTDSGEVAVGQITMGTGHAEASLRPSATIAHYDNTGTAIADIAAGEDEYGIWVAGRVRASATEEQVAILRAAALSGDWRGLGGNLELVAALAVNVPGFPIPRTQLAASGGRQTALVASGIVVRHGEFTLNEEEFKVAVAKAVEDHLSTRERRQLMASLKVASGRDPKSRMAALAQSRKG